MIGERRPTRRAHADHAARVTGPLAVGPLAVVLALVLAAVLVTGCSKSDKEAFCDALREQKDLTQLRNDLDRADRNAIEKDLQALEDLADDAPDEIAIDLHKVVNAVVQAVRAVISVTGPGGETIPPDLTRVNAALADVAESSQSVDAYADRECGFTLTR